MSTPGNAPLAGVIAAIATPIDAQMQPDIEAFLRLAHDLLEHGCDGLNVLGTTGEATSFSFAQRARVMRACAASLDVRRLMVGTGTASLADSIELTRLAAELGFSGALLLPPFYYKGVSEAGVFAYFAALVEATQRPPIPLYLYHFPALSGVPFSRPLVDRLLQAFAGRIQGLKDSSGDLAYSRDIAGVQPRFSVFPSNESCLMEARQGLFAGCISATCNLNAEFCRRAFHQGDASALAQAVAIRALFDGKPLVAGVKSALAHLRRDPGLAQVVPPLVAWSKDDQIELARHLDMLRGAIKSRRSG
jgi:4-hydroxy-tetrahydrodipicolinate synthase